MWARSFIYATGITVLLAGLAAPGEAMAKGQPPYGPTPWDGCFNRAGAYYQIHPLLLKALARQESSMNPRAINRNAPGLGYDFGLMQINSQHFPKIRKAGIPEERLWEPCVNITVGAWILSGCIKSHGMTWKAIGCYHSPTEWRQRNYAGRIYQHLVREMDALRRAEQGAL